MSSSWDSEEFRRYVTAHARTAGAKDQATLAKLTGIGTDQLGRYFRGQVQPGSDNLQKIAKAIPGTSYQHLMVLAGRAEPEQFGLDEAPPVPAPMVPEAEDLNYLLGPGSPLEPAEVEELRSMSRRLHDSFHKKGTRRRTA